MLLSCAFSVAPFSLSVSFSHSQGLYCNATTDQIGTCWPRASAGKLVERPCPEFFNGIKYNTTSKWKLLSFSGTSDVEKHLGTSTLFLPWKKKRREKNWAFPWELTFPPHSSLYTQNSCLEWCRFLRSSDFWTLILFLVNRVWADWAKTPPSIPGGCIVLADCQCVYMQICMAVCLL